MIRDYISLMKGDDTMTIRIMTLLIATLLIMTELILLITGDIAYG